MINYKKPKEKTFIISSSQKSSFPKVQPCVHGSMERLVLWSELTSKTVEAASSKNKTQVSELSILVSLESSQRKKKYTGISVGARNGS